MPRVHSFIQQIFAEPDTGLGAGGTMGSKRVLALVGSSSGGSTVIDIQESQRVT